MNNEWKQCAIVTQLLIVHCASLIVYYSRNNITFASYDTTEEYPNNDGYGASACRIGANRVHGK